MNETFPESSPPLSVALIKKQQARRRANAALIQRQRDIEAERPIPAPKDTRHAFGGHRAVHPDVSGSKSAQPRKINEAGQLLHDLRQQGATGAALADIFKPALIQPGAATNFPQTKNQTKIRK